MAVFSGLDSSDCRAECFVLLLRTLSFMDVLHDRSCSKAGMNRNVGVQVILRVYIYDYTCVRYACVFICVYIDLVVWINTDIPIEGLTDLACCTMLYRFY